MTGLSEAASALLVLAGLASASLLISHREEEMDTPQRYYFVALVALGISSLLRLLGPVAVPFVGPFVEPVEEVFAVFLGLSLYAQKGQLG